MTNQDRLMPLTEAMARLNVGKSTLYELLASGRLRSVYIGRRRLVSEKALSELIAALDGRAS